MGLQIGIADLDREFRLGIRIGDWLEFGIEDWGLVLGIGDWDCNLGLRFGIGIGIGDWE